MRREQAVLERAAEQVDLRAVIDCGQETHAQAHEKGVKQVDVKGVEDELTVGHQN